MAEVIRGGKRYNAATHRYLGPATATDNIVADLPSVETSSVYDEMTKAKIKGLLDEAEVSYPAKATHALLVEIAQAEIG